MTTPGPGTYDLYLTENQDNVFVFDLSDITTHVGASASVALRVGDKPTDTEVFSLAVGSGLTLATVAGKLRITMTITETQIDAKADVITAGGVAWSLKANASGGASRQYLKGGVFVTRTPTP